MRVMLKYGKPLAHAWHVSHIPTSSIIITDTVYFTDPTQRLTEIAPFPPCAFLCVLCVKKTNFISLEEKLANEQRHSSCNP
jgi:hypothetical protein